MSGPTVRLLVLGEERAASRALEALARARGAQVTRGPHGDVLSEDEIDRAFFDLGEGDPVSAVVLVFSFAAPAGRIGEWSLAAWEASIVSRLRLAFAVARRAVEEFLAGGAGGRIVHLAVTNAPRADAARGILHGALRSLVRSVAKEYGPKGIGCNAVLAAEGSTRDAERAAGTAWMLMAPEGAYVSGEVLELDADQGAGSVATRR